MRVRLIVRIPHTRAIVDDSVTRCGAGSCGEGACGTRCVSPSGMEGLLPPRFVRSLLLLAALVPAAAAQDSRAAGKAEGKAVEKARIAEIEVVLEATEDPHNQLPFLPPRRNYYGFLRFIRKAAADPELDAVILKPKKFAVGFARMLEVRDALKALRASGKKVFVYKERYTPADLLIASVADRVSLPEQGGVLLPGLAIEMLYMKGLLDKLKMRADVIHIGDYKTAGESLTREEMSKAQREALAPVLDEFFSSMVGALAEGRGISGDKVRAAIDRGLLSANDAKEFGLVDRIEYYDQFKDAIKAYFPERKLVWSNKYEKKGLKIDPNNPMAAFSMVFGSMFGQQKKKEPEGDKVAVVYCSGPITTGKSQYDWSGNIASMGSDTIAEAIDTARKDDSVKAIVLRVNSPGGSALASDLIWRAVERAKANKPVIASMGDVAASGGYYISMNSNRILAEPQTITGSIGVVGLVMNVSETLKWIGLNPQRMTRGKRAAGYMTTRGLNEKDREILRDNMQDLYGDFVAKVAVGRDKTPAEIHEVAQGRIWTGRAALAHGLADALGGLEDAIAQACRMGGIGERAKAGEDFHVLELPRRGGPFEALQEMFGARLGLDQLALRELPELRRALSHLRALVGASRDRVCLVHPELAGLTRVFAAPDR